MTTEKPKTPAQIYREANAAARKAADEAIRKYLAAGEDQDTAEAWAMEDSGDAMDAYLARHNL